MAIPQQSTQMPVAQQGAQIPTQSQAPVNIGQNRKAAQTNLLANLVPQIMNAIGGGDPYTQKVLAQQSQQYEQKIKDQNLQGFMRSVAMPASGEIKPDLIMQQAELWGVQPDVAMGVIQKFQAFRQAKRGNQTTAYRQVPAQAAIPATPGAIQPGTGDMSVGTAAIPGRPAGEIQRKVYENEPLPDGFSLDKFTPGKTETPKSYTVTVPGPNGPVEKLFTADQLKSGVQKYQAPEKGKTPTTAMGQFLKNNPTATADELVAFTQKLKTSDGITPDSYKYKTDKIKYVQTAVKNAGDMGVMEPVEIEKIKVASSVEFDATQQGWEKVSNPKTGERGYKKPNGEIVGVYGQKITQKTSMPKPTPTPLPTDLPKNTTTLPTDLPKDTATLPTVETQTPQQRELLDMLRQSNMQSGYTQPAPEVIPFQLKKRPSN